MSISSTASLKFLKPRYGLFAEDDYPKNHNYKISHGELEQNSHCKLVKHSFCDYKQWFMLISVCVNSSRKSFMHVQKNIQMVRSFINGKKYYNCDIASVIVKNIFVIMIYYKLIVLNSATPQYNTGLFIFRVYFGFIQCN